MRLTLRTLLAYLDDTLPPAQARQIGQQVAESEVAQELIQRIHAALKERRLTTPPLSGTGAKLDPNTVGEYLDNALTGEQLAEVEQVVLDSDLHLAEAAACHQILSLFLGQPAAVPVLARKRMYGLAKQPTAAPTGPRTSKPLPPDPDDEEEDEEEEGVPAYLRGSRPPVGALVAVAGLVLLLGLAVWQLWPRGPGKPGETLLASSTATGPEEKTTQPATQPAAATQPATQPIKPPEPSPEKPTEKPPEKPPEVPPDKQPIDKAPALSPSQERREGIGRQVILPAGQPSVLLSQSPGAAQWQRVTREGPVATTDTLMSLPGYRTELQLTTGVRLTLAGNLPLHWPEFTLEEFPALESRVVLHVPDKDMDADLTFARGRILLANAKAQGEARIRVRILPDEIWDITLPDKQGLICLERTGAFSAGTRFDKTGQGDGPMYFVYLWGLKGQAAVKIRYREMTLPEKALFAWNSWQGAPQGPSPAPAMPRWFADPKPLNTPYARDTKIAVDELGTRLANKPVEVAIAETRKEAKPASRILAVRCLAAIDAVANVADALGDDQDRDGRDLAVFSLRHWIGQKADHELQLYRVLQGKLGYTALQAEEVLDLLHVFSAQARQSPETYEKLIANLTHSKLAIRHLSYVWLVNLVPDGIKIKYDPAGDKESLGRGQADWRKRIPEGTVPPPPKPPK